jgi:hypothetical protein
MDGLAVAGDRSPNSAPDDVAAATIIRHCLIKRSSAPQRIGVPYRVRELCDPKEWAGVKL